MGQLKWKPQIDQLSINNLGKCHNLKLQKYERKWRSLALPRNLIYSFPFVNSHPLFTHPQSVSYLQRLYKGSEN
jgi:hypothetical protein